MEPASQLGRPAGPLTASLSVIEATWRHYGLVARRDGRLDLSVLAPAGHVTHGSVTWTLGLFPQMSMAYTPAGRTIGWGGFATLRVSHVPRME